MTCHRIPSELAEVQNAHCTRIKGTSADSPNFMITIHRTNENFIARQLFLVSLGESVRRHSALFVFAACTTTRSHARFFCRRSGRRKTCIPRDASAVVHFYRAPRRFASSPIKVRLYPRIAWTSIRSEFSFCPDDCSTICVNKFRRPRISSSLKLHSYGSKSSAR